MLSIKRLKSTNAAYKAVLANSRGEKKIHLFVKVAMGYLATVIGLAILALVFYEFGSREGPAITSAPPFLPSEVYAISITFFYTLIALSSIGLLALAKNLGIGAYLAFIVLVVSLFAPYDKQAGTAPFTIIWWFAIPNIVVGVLLLKAFKTLSPADPGIIIGRQTR